MLRFKFNSEYFSNLQYLNGVYYLVALFAASLNSSVSFVVVGACTFYLLTLISKKRLKL